MFTGEFIQKIDIKGRSVVPGKFRSILGENFFVTRNLDGCLAIYDKEAWSKLEDKLNSLPYTDKRARILKRFLLGASCELNIDKVGRILIPQALREETNLQDEIVYVGVGDHIEIWNKSTWDKDGAFADNDKLAESMEGLGI